MSTRQRLEQTVEKMTVANGQFTRPWMTYMTEPELAQVFVVGLNQATPITGNDHRAFVDALFNRNGKSCRAAYDAARGNKDPSPTRRNLDRLRAALGVSETLETNVVCYATPMSANLAEPEHAGGTAHGTALFRELVDIIRPPILIAHGSRTRRMVGKLLGAEMPSVPSAVDPWTWGQRRATAFDGDYAPVVYVIRSLAPPAWNRWSGQADACFKALSADVLYRLESRAA